MAASGGGIGGGVFFFKPLRWLRRLIVMGVFAAVLALGYLAVMNYLSSKVHETHRSDAIVVLGAAQFNGKPSPLFQNRLDHALAMYRAGVSQHIVTVGGNQPGDRFTEGQAGRDYLIGRGVPSSAVQAVKTGSNSWTSLQAVAAQLAPTSTYRITLVTDAVHMARVYDMSKALGFGAVYRNSTLGGAGSHYSPSRVFHECMGSVWFQIGQRWLQ
jgi:hypothetical protein